MKNSIGKKMFIVSFAKVIGLTLSMLCVMALSRVRTLEEYGIITRNSMYQVEL